MSITVGRLGLTPTLADEHASWKMDGDRMSLSGNLHNATLADAKTLRHQILGLVDNPDEPVVPFTWSTDADWDGFYRVLGGGVTIELAGSLDSGYFPFDLTLERVPGWASPLFELRTIGTVRANDHSITTSNTRPFVGLPDDIEGFSEFFTGSTKTTVAADGHTVRHYDGTTGAGRNHFFDATPSFFLAPSDFYDGAATIKIGGDIVVGRQAINTPTDWEIGNGLVRIVDGASAGEFNVEHWDGSAWDSIIYNYGLGTTWVDIDIDPHTVTVLRNTPEVCSVRFTTTAPASSGVDYAFTVDATVRRGSRFVETRFDSGAGFAKWGVTRSSVEAGTVTSLTGCMRANANDGNGNRYVMCTPHAATFDTTNGRLTRTSSTTNASWAFGAEVPGSTADPWDAQTLSYQFHSAVGERQRLSVR